MRIYFDNAATTPLDPIVIDEMVEVMKDHYANPSSIHADGRKARVLIEKARKTIANALNASVGEIFFTSCGTESNNMALKCAVRDLGVERIITSPIEHHCILYTAEFLHKNNGVAVEYINLHPETLFDYDHLRSLLSDKSKKTMVSLMHANNETGCMMDLDEVSKICAEYDTYFHSDTIQTIGHFPIDVQETKLSFLAGSAHKFHGPKGIGFLYVNSDNMIKPLLTGGGQERNMRAGTENIYGIVGMATALDLAVNEMDSRRKQITEVRNYFMNELRMKIPGAYAIGLDKDDYLYTVLNVSFPPSSKSSLLLLSLDMVGISASSGSACSSGSMKKSHVLSAMNEPEDRTSIRFSFSHFNTKEEVDQVVSKIQTILPETAGAI